MSGIPAGESPNQWRTVVISPNRALAAETEELTRACPHLITIETLRGYPDPEALPGFFELHGITLCLLDVASDRESAFQLLSGLQAKGATVAVVALVPPADADLVLRCLRQGAAGFLMPPLTPDQLSEVLNRLPASIVGAESSGARVVCVMPAKGACGATTVASNLACQFRKLGADKRVLLADLDPITGTIAFLWKLKSGYSFVDLLSHGSALDDDVWKGVVVPSHGIDVLLAPEAPVHGIDQGPGPEEIVHFARQTYDYLVLDTAGVYGDWALRLARLSDDILLVTSNEIHSVYGVRRSLTYLDQNRIPRSKVRVVVNRYRADVGLNRDAIQEMLGSEVCHILPADYDAIQRALVEGKAVNGCAFSKQLVTLAEKLGVAVAAAPENTSKPPAPKPSGLSGLFSLFGRRR